MTFGDWKRMSVAAAVLLSVCLVGARITGATSTKKVVVSGTLDVLQEDDFQRGKTRRIYRLVDDGTGQTILLQFKREPERDLITGTKVRVRGDQAAGEAVISVDGDSASTVVLQEAAVVTITRRALVLLVDFAGDSTGAGAGSVSCSQSQVADLFYTRLSSSGGNFDENYAATSYSQLAWDPNTDGIGGSDVFRVSISASVAESCSTSTWANKADTAATAAGIDLSLYQHRIYVIPNTTTNCSWAGTANVGCSTWCRAWVKGSSCATLDVYTHEVGHNLGMGHSSTDTDNDGVVDSTCASWGTSYSGGEYCDRSDFMGLSGAGRRHNSGPHKLQMGWVGSAKIVDASPGSYDIAPLGADPSSTSLPQLLRVVRLSGSPYYVSYRTNANWYEESLLVAYQQKTFVHTHTGGSSRTLLVTYLGDGQSFDDPVAGISISQTAHTVTSATVRVSTSTVCLPLAPSVAIAPANQAAHAGDARSYSLVVTNRDSVVCPASTFSLAAGAPSGWTSSLASASVTLSPGQQGSTSLTVTSGSAAANGSYPLSATATDAIGPYLSGSGTGSATYCVDASAPSPVTDLIAAIKQKTRVQLTWSIPSSTGCAAVASFDVHRDGVRLATTANTSYLDGSTTSGRTYSYTVIARDSLGMPSTAGNSVSVTISGGGGGKPR